MRKVILILLFFFACKDMPSPNNNSPEILSIVAADSSIASDTSVIVECIATDRDDDGLYYEWSSEEGEFEGIGSKVRWYPPQKSGNFNLICEVSDPLGGKDRSNIFIKVIKYDTISISFDDLYLNLRAYFFENKGQYYFHEESKWKNFQIDNGIDEENIILSGVDFSKSTLIVIFDPIVSGCEMNYQSLIKETKRYKNSIIVYRDSFQYYGPCFADMDPYQTVSVPVANAQVLFEEFF